ncbi:MAG TPA: AMP-binding protein, partial [bacterium]|nr:AMP-binding protein [bacterium]
MARINQKTLIRKTIGFCHLGLVFKLLANSRSRRDRPFFWFEGRTYTYGETYREARRFAEMFGYYRGRRLDEGRLKPQDTLAVGMYLDNCPEFVFALFGAAISGTALIAVNTGFRGETLANVLNTAEIGLVITSQANLAEIERMIPSIAGISGQDVLVVDPDPEKAAATGQDLAAVLADPSIPAAARFPKKIDVFTPLIVIYTSGTTGAPKGVPCNHLKLIGAGAVTLSRLRLGKHDKGYVCMPMFHSNAWYLGIMPLLLGGGGFVLKRRFSASAFEDDILEHGVTYLNYVGQPIHYILAALEKKHGSPEAVEAALAHHPQNKFRIATGNGAPPIDRQKMIRYLGMHHIYELYGSTEAPINACLKPGDPFDCLGRLTSKKVVILNERDEVCPPAEVDAEGRIANYDQAVGEIAKQTEQDNILFDGYFKNSEATGKKFRDGYFRSGDLGYVRIIDGKRYLYFVGRT